MPKLPAQLPGFETWGDENTEEPYEDHAGPFFQKQQENGKHLSAFIAQKHHMNGGGMLHGGLVMTFADYALFVIAGDYLQTGHAVTVSCQTEFLKGTGSIGQPVYADGEVTRNTKSLIFIRGRIYILTEQKQDMVIASFSGILKRIGIH